MSEEYPRFPVCLSLHRTNDILKEHLLKTYNDQALHKIIMSYVTEKCCFCECEVFGRMYKVRQFPWYLNPSSHVIMDIKCRLCNLFQNVIATLYVCESCYEQSCCIGCDKFICTNCTTQTEYVECDDCSGITCKDCWKKCDRCCKTPICLCEDVVEVQLNPESPFKENMCMDCIKKHTKKQERDTFHLKHVDPRDFLFDPPY